MQTELEKKDILRLSNEEANRITRECLRIALMKLMSEKDFSKITITELTSLAGVSRTAFYRNYNSKEEIIEETVNSVLTKMTASLERYKDHMKDWYILFFSVVKENADSVRIAYDAHVTITPIRLFDTIFPPENVQEHYANSAKEAAFGRILSDWFESGMKEDPEKMGIMCDKILGEFEGDSLK